MAGEEAVGFLGARQQCLGPEMWGITLEQLHGIAQLEGFLRRDHRATSLEMKGMTTREVVKNILVDLTRGKSMGYALLLNQAAPVRASVMVSHAWDDEYEAFLQALDRWASDKGHGNGGVAPTFWVCATALYQPEDTPGLKMADQLGPDPKCGPLATVLRQSSSLLAVVGAQCDIFTRLWCIYELHSAVQAGLEVEVVQGVGNSAALGGGDQKSVEDDLLADLCTSPVNSERAHCGTLMSKLKGSDEQMIRRQLEQVPGSYRTVNEVLERVRLKVMVSHEPEAQAMKKVSHKLRGEYLTRKHVAVRAVERRLGHMGLAAREYGYVHPKRREPKSSPWINTSEPETEQEAAPTVAATAVVEDAGGRRASLQSQGTKLASWMVFYHCSMEATAQEVVSDLSSKGAKAELCSVDWGHFNDGFPNLFVKKAGEFQHYFGTCLVLSLHSPEVIFEQLALLYDLPKMGCSNLRIILPWFSTGTMERVEVAGQIATANTLARLLSAVPRGPRGPATIVIYDIHALQEQFYFNDNVLVELKSAVWLLKSKLRELLQESPDEEIAIAFPDDGAHKRFKAKFTEYPMIVCSKVRVGDDRIVRVKEGDANGKHVIIVDDLVQSGGTLLECAKPLRQQGAKKVSCFVTHAVFPKESYKKFVGNTLIDKFFVTSSIPHTCAQIAGLAPFQVLSLAPLIADYLLNATMD